MAVSERATRSQNKYFLLDYISKDVSDNKLPSNHDVLGVFMRRHMEKKKTIRESAIKTIRDLVPIWTGKARIPVRPEHHAILQLETLYETGKI